MKLALVVVMALMVGCGTSEPAPAPAAPTATQKAPAGPKAKGPGPRAKAPPGAAKGPRGASGPGGRPAAKGPGRPPGARPSAKAPPKPVGAAGPVFGELVFTAVEAQPSEAPPAEAEGAAPAPAEAPAAASASPSTKVEIVFTWGEAETSTVLLGEVKGECKLTEPKPVGPEGRQRTPLWSSVCSKGGVETEVLVLQNKQTLMVFRSMAPPNVRKEAPEGQPQPELKTRYRPVKRIPLVRGAEVKRKS